jgi:hypothetical protein
MGALSVPKLFTGAAREAHIEALHLLKIGVDHTLGGK